MSLLSFAFAAGLSLAPIGSGAKDIVWQSEYEAALELAASEKKVVFIAVNMDGEKANDRFADEIYKSKRIAELSSSSINLIASNFDHSKKECSRFGTISCREHKQIDITVRSEVLKPDAQGFVVAPQHVFLSPAGEVLLSVPYEISEAELEWCFVTAIRRVDPSFSWRLTAGAKAPTRLILDGVFTPSTRPGESIRPVTRDEALALIKEVKRGMEWEETLQRLRQIMTSEEKEAMEFIKTQLRSGSGGGGGRGGGGRGGAGRGTDRRPQILRSIGAYAAPSYWEIVEDYADTSEDRIRLEGIVALEQLAAPESLRLVTKLMKKEKTQSYMKDWYRTLGSVGAADSRAKKTLLKATGSEKNRIPRINAIFALGYLVESEDVTAKLYELLDGDDADVSGAAALALGMTRNAEHVEQLKKRLEFLEPEEGEASEEAEAEEEAEDDEESLDVLSIKASIKVLEGGSLQGLRRPVRLVTKVKNGRPRIFGLGAGGAE